METVRTSLIEEVFFMRAAYRLAASCCALLLLAGCFGEASKNVEPSQTAAAPMSSAASPAQTPQAESANQAETAPAMQAPAPESTNSTDSDKAGEADAPSLAVQTSAPKDATPEETAPAPSADTKAEQPAEPAAETTMTVAALDTSLTAKSPAVEPEKTVAPEEPAAVTGARHIAVVGDSLAVGVGMTMEKNLKQYEGVACTPMGKVSTGLIAKKKYDWDRSLEELIRTNRPDALVVVMGGNDSNNNIGGKAAGSEAWKEAYSAKVRDFLKIASDGGVTVFWAGLPIMKDEAYSKRVEAANEAAKNACQAFSNCVYIDSWSMFADENGGYAAAKALDGGKTVSLRAKDGVHLTMTGYDYLCREILTKVAKNVELKPKSAK